MPIITIDFQDEKGHSLGFVRIRENGHTVAIAEGYRLVLEEEGRPTETHTWTPDMGECWGDPDPHRVVDEEDSSSCHVTYMGAHLGNLTFSTSPWPALSSPEFAK